MIEMGIIVALGLLVTMAKLPWRGKLWMTSHPLLMDAIVFVFLIAIHWGTFAGVMVATIGALFTSIVLSIARKLIGFIEAGKYYRGVYDCYDKL